MTDFSKEQNLKEKNEFRKNVIRSNDLPRGVVFVAFLHKQNLLRKKYNLHS
jgi:hypothetical protein